MNTKKTRVPLLRGLKEFLGCPIEASDGSIGESRDFLFDTDRWAVRYLVADTRKWLPGRKVLISPFHFGEPELGVFAVDLTKDKIKECPPLETDQPVSRRYELEMARFYNQHLYWVGPATWGGGMAPIPAELPPPSPEEWEEHARELKRIDRHDHLRSAVELFDYSVSTMDGEIGTLDEFVVEAQSWAIRWIIVDIRDRIQDRKVLVSPERVTGIDWHERSLSIDLRTEKVEQAPEFDHRLPINRDYEGRLCDFHGWPRYWEAGGRNEAPSAK